MTSKTLDEKLYHAQEFAKRTGTTVRTLHHYDRLGLLTPSRRTPAGFRLYGDRDLERLQQIAVLKFIGLPLKDIQRLLDQRHADLAETLGTQRKVLAEKRRHIDAAIQAIDDAGVRLRAAGGFDWEALRRIVEVIEMQSQWDWVEKYYTPEQLDELKARWSPEVQEKADRDWAALIADVEGALGEDPKSERAQTLPKRWRDLIAGFTGGNPDIEKNLRRLYADESNWPQSMKKPYSEEVEAFIKRAMDATSA